MPWAWIVRLNREIGLILTIGATEHVFGVFRDSSVQCSTDRLIDVLVITSFQNHDHWPVIPVAVVGGSTEYNFLIRKSLTTAFALSICEGAHAAAGNV